MRTPPKVLVWGRREVELAPNLREGRPPQPPEPPAHDKLWRVHRHQVVGVLGMLVIVVLAVGGWLGDTTQTFSGETGGLIIEVVAPERLRHRVSGPIELTVTNTTDTSRSAVVQIERGYLEAFSEVTFSPSVDSVDERWYTFELGELAPGQTAGVSGMVQADAIGWHHGVFRLGELSRRATTFTFP